MAKKVRRILVAVRELEKASASLLRKSAVLGKAFGARIELAHVITGLQREPVADAERRLRRFERSSALVGCRVQSGVLVDRPVHEAIIRRALASGAELVVAGTETRGRARRWFLRNTDWELIRHCPCPLLLAKSGRVREHPVILAALDPFHVHAKPAHLDEELLAAGQSLAERLGGTLHALHAYMPPVSAVEGPLGQPLMWPSPELEQLHTAQVRRAFDRLCERAKVPPARRHLMMGDLASQLRATIARAHVAVVVMGAVSRSAIRRALIGSSAERVLDQIPCDVLIVKPRGFRTQVRRRPTR
jgi:universal stress protein E